MAGRNPWTGAWGGEEDLRRRWARGAEDKWEHDRPAFVPADPDSGLDFILEQPMTAWTPCAPALFHLALVRGAVHRRGGDPAGRLDVDAAERRAEQRRREAGRVNEELVAAATRPGRAAQSVPAALTASEVRVARLAADGHTNRENAQELRGRGGEKGQAITVCRSVRTRPGNENSAASSSCIPVERTVMPDTGKEIEAVDVPGLGATLTHHVRTNDPPALDSVFVESMTKWCESVWDMLTDEGQWPTADPRSRDAPA
ncbi:hypothetical protein [Streptomyces sp. 6-11-2]|uniref:helix-turn-helix transcriptional regulator n=1 Tax=Streptomyces sp. 6-11-2 TaxID=2585753 RepID=UPI0011695AD4|nr:hypothetical protein [Streptomyces sp. 6-11-2]GED89986.1 hypothetical protein TNCT6_70710 [Streptomyces sp. 6-11-2]